MTTVRLPHNKIELALHQLSEGQVDGAEGQVDGSEGQVDGSEGQVDGAEGCHPLLLLHGLGEEAGTTVPLPWDEWPGAIWALDFTGHGASTVPAGGGYTCEVLASDVDIALSHVGPATVVGRGLGAYIGLMTAAARPELVRGLVLADGPGLAGGSAGPGSGTWFSPGDADGQSPDPFALFELSTDVRPPDYAMGFVRLMLDRSDLTNPITVTAKVSPPWLAAVTNEPGVVRETNEQARDRYAKGPKINA